MCDNTDGTLIYIKNRESDDLLFDKKKKKNTNIIVVPCTHIYIYIYAIYIYTYTLISRINQFVICLVLDLLANGIDSVFASGTWYFFFPAVILNIKKKRTCSTVQSSRGPAKTETGFFSTTTRVGIYFFFLIIYPFVGPGIHSLLFCPTYSLFIGEIYIKKEYKQKDKLGTLCGETEREKKSRIPFDIRSARWPDDSWMPIYTVFASKQVPFCVLLFFFSI